MDKYQATKDRYLKEKVEEFKIRVPKGKKAFIQAIAKQQGKSLNSFVVDIIEKAYDILDDEDKKEIDILISNIEKEKK